MELDCGNFDLLPSGFSGYCPKRTVVQLYCAVLLVSRSQGVKITGIARRA